MTAITFHEPVVTADNKSLGVAQRIYRHADTAADVATEPYEGYLKVVDLRIGDTYFIPLEYLEERTAASAPLRVRLRFGDVEELTLSRTPRFIAYGETVTEELDQVA